MGKSARKVVKHLEGLGISLEGAEYFQVDIAASMFYPNHINGVIDKCLGGKNRVEKFFKAQDHGWYYFAKPVSDMLATRESAQNTGIGDLIGPKWDPIVAAMVYEIICTSLLPHDMNATEVLQLLYDIPCLLPDKDDVLAAIHICKDRDARSIPYLHGILERQGANLRARLKERDENRVEVWLPDEVTDTITTEDADAAWARVSSIVKSMREINESSSRSRRRS